MAGYPFETLARPRIACRYLMGHFNVGWPWQREYLTGKRLRLPIVKLWAYDHFCSLARAFPLSVEDVRPGDRQADTPRRWLKTTRQVRTLQEDKIAPALREEAEQTVSPTKAADCQCPAADALRRKWAELKAYLLDDTGKPLAPDRAQISTLPRRKGRQHEALTGIADFGPRDPASASRGAGG
jgi:hypothetical protein